MGSIYRIVFLIFGLFLLTACGTSQSSSAQQLSPTLQPHTAENPPAQAEAPLLQIHFTGGLCQYGACSREVTFEHDGLLVIKDGERISRQAQLDQTELEALKRQIAQADLTAIMSRPFTGTCPTAYDGQEVSYSFLTSQGIVRLSSCKVVIDEQTPPFSTALALLTKYGN
ncbi:MAG: hypothetical protein KatS3mg057_1874 [Herpetosiphonaceae bacterium]|nr:MAG: hypothetical protein KatS3mg057_1874 [Herpetosiphonaceae bacterium]